MIRDFPAATSAVLEEKARAWFADPQAGPIRLASTVLLVRDAGDGVEVFVQRRVGSMAFAPSMYVFPGGGVDERDATTDLPWAGPPVDHWAGLLRTGPDRARALVAAAVREVFEESGVLLAGPDEESVVADLDRPVWHDARADLLARRRSLTEVLRAQGLVLRADLLTYRAHWITPEFEPRRYDTRFFAATVPAGQVPDGATTEADVVRWVAPRLLLEEEAAGTARMLPPTLVCLEDLAGFANAAEFLAHRPVVHPILPELVETEGGLVIRSVLP